MYVNEISNMWEQLPGRVSTVISGLTSLPSGNGRLSGVSTAGERRKNETIKRSNTGTIHVRSKVRQENVTEKTGRASVSESVEMLEEQRCSTVCWKHMRKAPIQTRVTEPHDACFQLLILWKEIVPSLLTSGRQSAGRDGNYRKCFQHEWTVTVTSTSTR